VGYNFSTQLDDYKDGADYIFAPESLPHKKKAARGMSIQANSGCAGAFCNFLEINGLNKTSTQAINHL
jgi:hypothetical protein